MILLQQSERNQCDVNRVLGELAVNFTGYTIYNDDDDDDARRLHTRDVELDQDYCTTSLGWRIAVEGKKIVSTTFV